MIADASIVVSAPHPPQQVVVIGASVGAIGALGVILPALPADYPIPVLVVVHIPRHTDSLLPSIFQQRCPLVVKEAEDKEALRGGVIYFAPPDYHLLVNPDFTLALSSDEAVNYSRPSVDVLFESAAEAFGDGVTGVILTGSNEDGAAGIHAVCAAGGGALVQTPASAEGKAMPLTAIAACPSARVLELLEIAEFLKAKAIP